MEKLRVIIIGVGTGGHIFPAISIANAIKEAVAEAEILFVGATGRMEMERVPAAGYKIIGIPARGLKRPLYSLSNIKVAFDYLKCRSMAKKIIKEFKPDVVVGVGVNLFFDKSEAPKEIRDTAGSLFDLCGVEYDALTLCANITNEFEKLCYCDCEIKQILSQYRERSVILGREISVIRGDESIRAAALDICDDGALLVRYEDGFTAKLCGGEISIRQRKM